MPVFNSMHYQLMQNTKMTFGQNSMQNFLQIDMAIAQFGLKMRFLLLGVMPPGELFLKKNPNPTQIQLRADQIKNRADQYIGDLIKIENIFRATEKWSETNGLQTLANHEITNIEYYPELFIVPSDFCQ